LFKKCQLKTRSHFRSTAVKTNKETRRKRPRGLDSRIASTSPGRERLGSNRNARWPPLIGERTRSGIADPVARSVFSRSRELESSKFQRAAPRNPLDSPIADEDLIDTGRCRRTKLCKVVGFRPMKPSSCAILGSAEITDLSKMIIDRGD